MKNTGTKLWSLNQCSAGGRALEIHDVDNRSEAATEAW